MLELIRMYRVSLIKPDGAPMRSSTAKMEREESSATVSNQKLDSFVVDLSDLCRKHGIGITGNPTLFVMEPVDYQLSYHVDAGSNLSFR
jgi:hypothetical protein